MFEEKTGTILRFTGQDTGYVSDSTMPGTEHPFEHHGAQLTFVENEGVSFLLLSTPSGQKKAIRLGR